MQGVSCERQKGEKGVVVVVIKTIVGKLTSWCLSVSP